MKEIKLDLDSLLREIKEQQNSIIKDFGSKKNYFQQKIQFSLPDDQEKRLSKALLFINQFPVNYEAAILLFDPTADQKHSDWLLLLGFIYSQHIDNKFFDPEKSFLFCTRSSLLGNPAASYNLFVKYRQGFENEINLDAAMYWLKRAQEQGHKDAKYLFATTRKQFDKRFYDQTEKEFKKKIYEDIYEAETDGSLLAMNFIANLLGAGRYYNRDHKGCIQRYKIISQKGVEFGERTAKYGAIWKYALRSYLGLGTQIDNNLVVDLLNKIPPQSYLKYISQNLKFKSALLRDILSREQKNGDLYAAGKEKIRKAIEINHDPKILVGDTTMQCHLDVTWVIKELAFEEEWFNRYEWERALQKIQANRMQFSLDDALYSTLIIGPRYNEIGKNGLPILGKIKVESDSSEVLDYRSGKIGSFVPSPGRIGFEGLLGNADGTITLDFRFSDKRPALILDEDIETALVLAFGGEKLSPLLSLEDPNRHGITDEYRCFEFKEWNPEWLGHTDLGRTLYYTDQLIGRLCWFSQEFEIGLPEETLEPYISELALDLVEDIVMTGGRDGKGAYMRVMLVPEHIAFDITKPSENQVRIKVKEVKMRVDGNYFIKGEGTDKDIHLVKNDDTNQQGRTVNKLTRRYQDISNVLPVFARARELVSLINALSTLRDEGFKLHPGFQKQLSLRNEELKRMQPLPLSEQLCVPLPLTYKYP